MTMRNQENVAPIASLAPKPGLAIAFFAIGLLGVLLVGCGVNEYPKGKPIAEQYDEQDFANNSGVVVHQYQQSPIPNVEFDPFLKQLLADYQVMQRSAYINAGCNFFEPPTAKKFNKDLGAIVIGIRNYFVRTLEMTQEEAAYAVSAVQRTAQREASQVTNTCLREAEMAAYQGYLLAKRRVGEMRLYEFR